MTQCPTSSRLPISLSLRSALLFIKRGSTNYLNLIHDRFKVPREGQFHFRERLRDGFVGLEPFIVFTPSCAKTGQKGSRDFLFLLCVRGEPFSC
jgi:hypothetical protein